MSLADRVTWREGAIFPQVQLSQRFGAVKEQLGHAMFFINLPMSLVNLSVGYYATPVKTMLPLWQWYLGAFLLFGGSVVAYHVFLHKSWVRFTTGQGADEEANPQYRKMIDDHADHEKMLREILNEVQD